MRVRPAAGSRILRTRPMETRHLPVPPFHPGGDIGVGEVVVGEDFDRVPRRKVTHMTQE